MEASNAGSESGGALAMVPRSLDALPLGTKLVLSAITLVDVLLLIAPPTPTTGPACFGSETASVFSFFLAPLAHASALHYFFNALAFLASGIALEPFIGTMPFLGLNALLVLLTQLSFWLLQLLLQPVGLLATHTCVLGYSGVIFGIVAFETYSPAARAEYSLCGLVNVPSRAFPFALVALCWVLMPHASLLGHLIGVLWGIALFARCPADVWHFFVACAPFRWRDAASFRFPQWARIVPSHLRAGSGHEGLAAAACSRAGPTTDFPSLPSVSAIGGLVVGARNFVPFSGAGRTLGAPRSAGGAEEGKDAPGAHPSSSPAEARQQHQQERDGGGSGAACSAAGRGHQRPEEIV